MKTNAPCAPVIQSLDAVDPASPATGSVRLRGVSVSLTTNVGEEFVTDFARHLEGSLSDAEIKRKWELRDDDWAELATNAPTAYGCPRRA